MADPSPHQPDQPDAPEVAISSVNPAASEMRLAVPERPITAPPPPQVIAPVPARSTASDIEVHISEFAADVAGGLSPFGDDVEFPLPFERLGYRHPRPANRPALAGD
jgi:succinate dehydrogenase / fumarate reductase, iron-sulfur subunit